VGEPVLVGMVAGGWLAWRRGLRAPLVVLAAGLAAFAVLAVAGLPIITRYVLLPAALATILTGGALAAGLRDRAWAPVSVLVLVVLLVFTPGQVRRLDRLERSLAIQQRILTDLDALPAEALRGERLAVVNRRPVPHLALRFAFIEPGDVLVGPAPGASSYVAPANREVAGDFVFDPRDRVQVLPRLPPSFRRVAANASWAVFTRRR
jgi:hypothetical protein